MRLGKVWGVGRGNRLGGRFQRVGLMGELPDPHHPIHKANVIVFSVIVKRHQIHRFLHRIGHRVRVPRRFHVVLIVQHGQPTVDLVAQILQRVAKGLIHEQMVPGDLSVIVPHRHRFLARRAGVILDQHHVAPAAQRRHVQQIRPRPHKMPAAVIQQIMQRLRIHQRMQMHIPRNHPLLAQLHKKLHHRVDGRMQRLLIPVIVRLELPRPDNLNLGAATAPSAAAHTTPLTHNTPLSHAAHPYSPTKNSHPASAKLCVVPCPPISGVHNSFSSCSTPYTAERIRIAA